MITTFAQQSSSASLDVTSIVVGLAGGLALFLYGMGQLTGSLKAITGNRLRSILGTVTQNRFTAAGVGAFITAIIQSSSVTTVLVVGFISAGVMTLQQSVGVIMGANIGTTLTAQIVAFKVTSYAMVMIAAGFGLTMFAKRPGLTQSGALIMGLGLVFFGMNLMSDATAPLRDWPPFVEWMGRMSNPLLGIVVGAVFTAIVQSSSATTGIIIVLASQGFITLPAGIALALGANVGTSSTALLASFGRPREAQQAALIHTMFNVGGALLWVGFLDQLAALVVMISPGHPELDGAERVAAEAPRQIANAHTAFNVINTFVFIWFTGPLASLARRIAPDKPMVVPDRVEPQYLDPVFLKTPPLALDRVQLELTRLGKLVGHMMDGAEFVVLSGTDHDLERIRSEDDQVDALYDAIILYISRISQGDLGSEDSRELASLTAIASYLENIGDNIETNLVALGKDRLYRQVHVSPETRQRLDALDEGVREAFAIAMKALKESDVDAAVKVIEMKSQVHELAGRAADQLRRRLAARDDKRLATFRVETDLVEHLLRQFYFTRKIAKELVSIWTAPKSSGTTRSSSSTDASGDTPVRDSEPADLG